MEMYDMKPDAPADYRGEFRPIATNVPGLDVCEHMPLHAKIADKYNIIRSVAHKFADHGGGHKRFLTGRDPKEPTGFVNDFPVVGSIVAKMREQRNIGLPNYISGTEPGARGSTSTASARRISARRRTVQRAGRSAGCQVRGQEHSCPRQSSDRLDDRVRLAARLRQLRREVDDAGLMDAIERFNQKAVSLLTSDRARQAFDLSQEPDELRDRYGRHAGDNGR